jgi:hypothetical protein
MMGGCQICTRTSGSAKAAALILDVGGPVKPFITPDDVPRVAEIIRQLAGLSDIPYAGLGPVI